MISTEMGIHWSGHAIERAFERFNGPGSLPLPEERIRAIAEVIPVGKEFSVREKNVVFGCIRDTNGCVIRTVYEGDWV